MPGYHTFSLGSAVVTTLQDGSGQLPFSKLFPNVPQATLQAARARLGLGPVTPTGMTLLHVQIDGQSILIDCGLPQGQLAESMRAAGINPAAVDVLIITHGDSDHIGGLANFPNARVYLPQRAWDLWTSAAGRALLMEEWTLSVAMNFGLKGKALAARSAERARYGTDILPTLSDRLTLVNPETEFLSGIRFVEAPGHRSDHFAVEIESDGQTLLHCVDAFRHPLQAAHPNWIEFFSTYPAQAAHTIRQLMTRAADADAIIFCSHMPMPGLARITRNGDAFTWHTL